VSDDEHDDRVIPFTVKERRRIDSLDRAVSGYYNEKENVYVPGLLQNTYDSVQAMRTIRKLVWFLALVAVANTLHIYGVADLLSRIAGVK
jgi:hypothetical protein